MRVVYRLSDQLTNKPRPGWFSKIISLSNALFALGTGHEWHFIADRLSDWRAGSFAELVQMHLASYWWHPIEAKNGGDSMRHALDIGLNGMRPDDIVYFCEDDYLHLPGSAEAIREGVEDLDADCVSLYDHPDKYPPAGWPPDTTLVVRGGHWRSAPSTTMTFAAKAGYIYDRRETILKHCQGEVPADNAMFRELSACVRTAVPGLATHCEIGMLSPCVDWDRVARVALLEYESRATRKMKLWTQQRQCGEFTGMQQKPIGKA